MRKLAVLLLVIAGFACRGEPHATSADRDPKPVDVDILTVTRSMAPSFYEASGATAGVRTAELSARVGGYVRTVAVEAGAEVAAGDLLIELDTPELESAQRAAQSGVAAAHAAQREAQAGYDAAVANAEVARATWKRYELLREGKAATAQELDEVEARRSAATAAETAARSRLASVEAAIGQAEAGLAAARTMAAYATIRAPFAGRIIARNADPGSLAGPGRTLLVIEASAGGRAESWVDGSLVGRIRIGDRATVTLDPDGRERVAQVVEVVPRIDVTTRSFLVKLDVDDDRGTAPGTFVRVRFAVEPTPRLLVPTTAIRERGQLVRVLTVVDGRAHLQIVTLGERFGDQVEVLSGLAAGERIVASWTDAVGDGVPVRGDGSAR